MNRRHPSGLLLDTHVLLWWLAEPDRLSPAALAAIADPAHRVSVSAASGWEIATKVRLGKLLAAQGFEPLPVTLVHGLHAGRYPMAHRDPLDRILAAQAELGGLTLVSLDPAFQAFPCGLLW